MTSTSPVGPQPRARSRQQEVIMELGREALEKKSLDRSRHLAAVAIAEMLDNHCGKALPARDDVGSGLALCERITERREGRTRADPKPDEGATFSFALSAPEIDD